MCTQHLKLHNDRWHRAQIEKKLKLDPNDNLQKIALRETIKRINRLVGKLAEANRPKMAGICIYRNCRFKAMPNSNTCLSHGKID